MSLNSTIATYDGAELRSYSYARHLEAHDNIGQIFDVCSLTNIVTLCHKLAIDTLWIVPGCDLSRHAKQLLVTAGEDITIYNKSCTSDGTPRFLLLGRKEGNKKSIKLAFPEWDSRWPWARCTDGYTLLKSILYLQDALQHEIAWGPGWVGQDIIKELNAKHPNWLAPVELPDAMKDKTKYALARNFHRALSDEEKQPGMWVFLFDGNSKYLAACTSVYIGEGKPEHLTENVTFQARVPGLWKLKKLDGPVWMWTPELEYEIATSRDLLCGLEEAYVWPRYHEALRSWGNHMWKARQALNENRHILGEACEMAYEAIKEIYVETHGWFAKAGRPDVWSMMVAQATRSTGFKRRQMAQKYGLKAFYMENDMLGFVSEGPSLDRYHAMLNRAGLLGGYKLVASGPLTPELAAGCEGDWRACAGALAAWRKIYE